MKIIALGHKKNVGKDTFAKYLKLALIEEYRKRSLCPHVTIVSVSEVLFAAAYELFGWAGMQESYVYNLNYGLKDQVLPKIGKTPRDVVKIIADGARSIDPLFPLKAALWTPYKESNQIKILTNLRFFEEAYYLRTQNARLVKIERPTIKPDLDDPFDVALDDFTKWDNRILNNGTLDELREAAERLSRVIIKS